MANSRICNKSEVSRAFISIHRWTKVGEYPTYRTEGETVQNVIISLKRHGKQVALIYGSFKNESGLSWLKNPGFAFTKYVTHMYMYVCVYIPIYEL